MAGTAYFVVGSAIGKVVLATDGERLGLPMYLFYVDESGEREYESPARYFALCALGVPVHAWRAINTEMLTLKRTYFQAIDVEIKSNWLRIPKERKKHYLSVYPITEGELIEFTDKLYDLLLSHDVVVIAAVIDKERTRKKYAAPQAPSSLAYRLLFERIERFLANRQAFGAVVFDKITELEVTKKGYENLLSRQHQRYLEKGTEFVQISQIVEGLLFIPSHENNLLQLADLCAYNVYRQFVDYGDERVKEQRFGNRYPYFSRIEPKLNTSPAGHYAGWGVKLFP